MREGVVERPLPHPGVLETGVALSCAASSPLEMGLHRLAALPLHHTRRRRFQAASGPCPWRDVAELSEAEAAYTYRQAREAAAAAAATGPWGRPAHGPAGGGGGGGGGGGSRAPTPDPAAGCGAAGVPRQPPQGDARNAGPARAASPATAAVGDSADGAPEAGGPGAAAAPAAGAGAAAEGPCDAEAQLRAARYGDLAAREARMGRQVAGRLQELELEAAAMRARVRAACPRPRGASRSAPWPRRAAMVAFVCRGRGWESSHTSQPRLA
jgi:hypothetical protein